MSVLANKTSIFELPVFVREHAQYLAWQENYSQRELEDVLNPYMNLSCGLYNKGLNKDEEAVEEFRHLSYLAIIELEKCNQY